MYGHNNGRSYDINQNGIADAEHYTGRRLVSMRSSIKSREMTDEQRQAAAERLRAARVMR